MEQMPVIALVGSPLVPVGEITALGETGCAFDLTPIPWTDAPDAYAAVFVFAETPDGVIAETVKGYVGHPHLRVICGNTAEAQLCGLRQELRAALGQEECERKFLVTYPDLAALEQSPFAASSRITQTYLLSEDGATERVRARETGGRTVYTHTVKRRIDRLTSEEYEDEIDGAAYRRLLLRADPSRKAVEKVRWCILHGIHYFELDVYPFWKDRAVVELELSEQGTAPIDFPPFFRLIREVTDDVRYKNVRLAREIPMDPVTEIGEENE